MMKWEGYFKVLYQYFFEGVKETQKPQDVWLPD
jgi:hypothetical protein